VTNSRIQSS